MYYASVRLGLELSVMLPREDRARSVDVAFDALSMNHKEHISDNITPITRRIINDGSECRDSKNLRQMFANDTPFFYVVARYDHAGKSGLAVLY